MIKLELHRLPPPSNPPEAFYQKYPQYRPGLLETRHNISDPDLNKYFVKEFGEDGNGGITNALGYVGQKYGGGKYHLRAYRHGKYVHSNVFEISGLPKAIYVSPFTGEVK